MLLCSSNQRVDPRIGQLGQLHVAVRHHPRVADPLVAFRRRHDDESALAAHVEPDGLAPRAWLAVVEADKSERQYRLHLPTDDHHESQRIRQVFGPSRTLHHQTAELLRIAETPRYAVFLAQHWLDDKERELTGALKAIPVWRAQFADVAAQVAKEGGR